MKYLEINLLLFITNFIKKLNTPYVDITFQYSFLN